MSERVKYLIGNLAVIVNDNDRNKITVTTNKKYPQLSEMKGKGFSLLKDGRLRLTCTAKEYSTKIMKLEELLYEIETKSDNIQKAIKALSEESKNDSSNSSLNRKPESGRNAKSDKSKDNGTNKG